MPNFNISKNNEMSQNPFTVFVYAIWMLRDINS